MRSMARNSAAVAYDGLMDSAEASENALTSLGSASDRMTIAAMTSIRVTPRFVVMRHQPFSQPASGLARDLSQAAHRVYRNRHAACQLNLTVCAQRDRVSVVWDSAGIKFQLSGSTDAHRRQCRTAERRLTHADGPSTIIERAGERLATGLAGISGIFDIEVVRIAGLVERHPRSQPRGHGPALGVANMSGNSRRRAALTNGGQITQRGAGNRNANDGYQRDDRQKLDQCEAVASSRPHK